MSRTSHRKPVKGPSQRQLRVGEEVRHILAEFLARGEVRDPVLAKVSVTVSEVRVSPDLRNATVFCTPLGGRDAAAVVSALNRHRGFLRGELGHGLTLRYTPALNFVHDEGFDRAAAMDALLRSPELKADLAADEADGEEGGNGGASA